MSEPANVSGDDVRAAADHFGQLLTQTAEADWSVAAGGLEWTVDRVVTHVGDCFVFYAANLVAGGTPVGGFDLRFWPSKDNRDRLATVHAFGATLAVVVDASAPGARGWHPFGVADASGMAAMACDEALVHAADVAAAYGLDFEPDPALCDRVLRRLFPETPAEVEGWPGLLWANGRIALPDRPQRTRWKFHCAPLAEWDGGTVAAP